MNPPAGGVPKDHLDELLHHPETVAWVVGYVQMMSGQYLSEKQSEEFVRGIQILIWWIQFLGPFVLEFVKRYLQAQHAAGSKSIFVPQSHRTAIIALGACFVLQFAFATSHIYASWTEPYYLFGLSALLALAYLAQVYKTGNSTVQFLYASEFAGLMALVTQAYLCAMHVLATPPSRPFVKIFFYVAVIACVAFLIVKAPAVVTHKRRAQIR